MKLIVPLGQEQYPEESKEVFQVPDYQVTFEKNDSTTETVLIEVRLVDGGKQTLKLRKCTYAGLAEYEKILPFKLLFAIF